MRIAIASDHAGYYLKELLLNRLAAEPDLTLVDLGTNAASPPVDSPDYAQAAAEAVVQPPFLLPQSGSTALSGTGRREGR